MGFVGVAAKMNVPAAYIVLQYVMILRYKLIVRGHVDMTSHVNIDTLREQWWRTESGQNWEAVSGWTFTSRAHIMERDNGLF
jgi:hypothetical protein